MSDIRYEYVDVDGTANEETLSTIISSTEEEPKTILALDFAEDTGSLQGDAILRAYIERERIVDINVRNTTESDANNKKVENFPINFGPGGLALPQGQDLKVGQQSQGTASDFVIAVKYEITG